jgi:hypothetical protein
MLLWRVTCSGGILRRNLKRFQGGLASNTHRLSFHSTLGSRVTKKKKKNVPAAATSAATLMPQRVQHADSPKHMPACQHMLVHLFDQFYMLVHLLDQSVCAGPSIRLI